MCRFSLHYTLHYNHKSRTKFNKKRGKYNPPIFILMETPLMVWNVNCLWPHFKISFHQRWLFLLSSPSRCFIFFFFLQRIGCIGLGNLQKFLLLLLFTIYHLSVKFCSKSDLKKKNRSCRTNSHKPNVIKLDSNSKQKRLTLHWKSR